MPSAESMFACFLLFERIEATLLANHPRFLVSGTDQPRLVLLFNRCFSSNSISADLLVLVPCGRMSLVLFAPCTI